MRIWKMASPSSAAPSRAREDEPIVITGIGLITALGSDRESVWQAVRRGRSGVRWLKGIPGIPDETLLGASIDLEIPAPRELKSIALARHAASEAMEDAGIDLEQIDLNRFGCAISGHMGDTGWILRNAQREDLLVPDALPWFHQWMPNTSCSQIANSYGLRGPRLTHSVACASGLVDILSAVRTIRDDQCDIALAGSGDAIQPLFAAGFDRMKVLARHDDPTQACRPFDRHRNGFVLGEGSAVFVIERLSHAEARGAKIYAEIVSGRMLAEAHHVTGLDQESEALARLISETLREAHLRPDDIQYINAHGTGTLQNDVVETRGIRLALGEAAEQVCVSATKSMLGHLINAAGSVELAVTALALRDGYAPPTLNLTNPDPTCNLDCVPLVGRRGPYQHALKISVAFGGHLVAVALRRWDEQGMAQAAPAA